MTQILNSENARAFNSSLKKAFKEAGLNVKVEIINSYKFPNCWVRVHPVNTTFSNEWRLKVFDAAGHDRAHLGNADNISYGNIQSKSISSYVQDWEKVFTE